MDSGSSSGSATPMSKYLRVVLLLRRDKNSPRIKNRARETLDIFGLFCHETDMLLRSGH